MKPGKDVITRLPGWLSSGLMIVVSVFWTYWGTAEMYYEGWGNPFPGPLAYLIPGAVCMRDRPHTS